MFLVHDYSGALVYIKLSIYKDSEIWQNSDFALVYINQVIAFLIDNQSNDT